MPRVKRVEIFADDEIQVFHPDGEAGAMHLTEGHWFN